ncbi:MAG: hypothetical protein ACR2PF_06325 [Rhizobiaceae bacterium]
MSSAHHQIGGTIQLDIARPGFVKGLPDHFARDAGCNERDQRAIVVLCIEDCRFQDRISCDQARDGILVMTHLLDHLLPAPSCLVEWFRAYWRPNREWSVKKRGKQKLVLLL